MAKSAKTPWKNTLDRDDNEILWKVIQAGRIMRATRCSYQEAAARLETGAEPMPPIPRGKTLRENDRMLKQLLKDAHAVNPVGLVEVAVAGNGMMKGLMARYPELDRESFVSDLAIGLVDRYHVVAALRKEEREARGQKEDIFVDDDLPKRQARTSNAVGSWDPANAGIIYYLRDYINTTLKGPTLSYHLKQSYLERVALGIGAPVSLEQLSEVGLDLSDRGFVRASRSRGMDEPDTEGVEEEDFGEVDDPSDVLAANKLDNEDEDEQEDEDLGVEERAARKNARVVGFAFPPANQFNPNSLRRYDAMLLADILEVNDMDPDPIRQAASSALQQEAMKVAASQLAEAIEGIPGEEKLEICELIKDWNPGAKGQAAALWVWAPEWTEFFARSGKSVRFDPEGAKLAKGVEAASATVSLMAGNESVLSETDSPEVSDHKVELALARDKAWRMVNVPEGIAPGERADFRYLSMSAKSEAPAENDPEKFAKQMKELGRQLIQQTFRVQLVKGIGESLEKAIADWNPNKVCFSGVLNPAIAKMIERDELSPEQHAFIADTLAAVSSTGEVVQDELADVSEAGHMRRRRKTGDAAAHVYELLALDNQPKLDPDRINAALAQTKGNPYKAAALLGLPRAITARANANAEVTDAWKEAEVERVALELRDKEAAKEKAESVKEVLALLSLAPDSAKHSDQEMAEALEEGRENAYRAAAILSMKAVLDAKRASGMTEEEYEAWRRFEVNAKAAEIQKQEQERRLDEKLEKITLLLGELGEKIPPREQLVKDLEVDDGDPHKTAARLYFMPRAEKELARAKVPEAGRQNWLDQRLEELTNTMVVTERRLAAEREQGQMSLV